MLLPLRCSYACSCPSLVAVRALALTDEECVEDEQHHQPQWEQYAVPQHRAQQPLAGAAQTTSARNCQYKLAQPVSTTRCVGNTAVAYYTSCESSSAATAPLQEVSTARLWQGY